MASVKLLWPAAFVALGSVACASASEPVAQIQPRLSGGTLDLDHTGVFALHVGGPSPGLCSAVLIAPNLLLTARHCVETRSTVEVVCGQTELADFVDPAAIVTSNELSFLDNLDDLGHEFPVSEILAPPGANELCGFDLATLLLDDTVEPDLAAPLTPRLEPAVREGDEYSAVGYGRLAESSGARAGLRLALEDRVVECQGGGCANIDPEHEFLGADGVCQGDSGGPALDADERVIGIASRSAEGCRTPVYVSIAAFGPWLTEVAVRAAERGNYPLPSWAAPVVDEKPVADEPTDTGNQVQGELGAEGEPCSERMACGEGLDCLYEGLVSDARCARKCNDGSDCRANQYCDDDLAVCRNEGQRSGRGGGCSVAPNGNRRAPSSHWYVLVVAGAVLRRWRAHGRDGHVRLSPLGRLAVLLAAGVVSSLGGCGSDEPGTPTSPQAGIIVPDVSSGGAGGSQEDAGAHGQAGAPPADWSSFGERCDGANDCGDDLTCLTATSRSLESGGPPGGLCTLSCDDDSTVCEALDARCLDFGRARYCLAACELGASFVPQGTFKCQDREDFACEPTYRATDVACDQASDCGTNAVCRNSHCYVVESLCLPRCNGDADCAAPSHCDPVSGECVRDAAAGLPFGAKCDPNEDPDPCRGVCLLGTSGDSGRCTEFCTFDSARACSDGEADAACLLPLNESLTAVPGDLAACASLCDCDADCDDGLTCVQLTASVNGRTGYCSLTMPLQGTLTCGEGGGPG